MSKKLTLVVGAGASCELGLPSGVQLKEKMAELLDIKYEHGFRQISGDYAIRRAMEVCVRQKGDQRENINPCLHAGWIIKDAMPLAISIDNFLDAHQGVEKIEICGKLAIARA